MTYRRFILGHHLDSRFAKEVRESMPRTAQLNAESEAKSIRRLQAYQRPRPPRESDMAMWTTNQWMD